MPTRNLLYQRTIDINDKIHLVIPTVAEIIEDEDNYYGLVNLITAMPVDMLVQLDDLGINFAEINDYELFLFLVFPTLQQTDTSMIFGDLDLSKFNYAKNEETDMIVLVDSENDIVIDRPIFTKIAMTLRKIHNLKKDNRKPGNEEAQKYMLERARKKLAQK